MDAAGLAKLLSPHGWALLSALPPYDEARTIALSDRLRREGIDPDLIAAALTQSRLRAKAHAKFDTFADGMLFTPAGLEQATRLPVAAHHARRFLAAGVTRVADLTCGVGADSMAFAGVGLTVLAADTDELTAALATVNLRHFPEAEVRHVDGLGLDFEAEGVDGLYADPARRASSGRRLFDPGAYAPPLGAVLALRDRVPALGVKIGPGVPHSGLPADAETQWVSVDEPDGAVIRAGLVAQIAAEVQGRLVDRTIAYITSDTVHHSDAATGYRVLDTLPFGLKRLRTYLRERDVGRLTIKKRGTAVLPEQLRKQLDLRGRQAATIVLTRVAGAQHVIVAEPL